MPAVPEAQNLNSQKIHGSLCCKTQRRMNLSRKELPRCQGTLFAFGPATHIVAGAFADHNAFKPRSMPCFARFAALCIPLAASATCLSTALH